MTTLEDMQRLAAQLARLNKSKLPAADQTKLDQLRCETDALVKELENSRRQQLARIRDAYARLDDAIYDAFELTDDERRSLSLQEWTTVNLPLLEQADTDGNS